VPFGRSLLAEGASIDGRPGRPSVAVTPPLPRVVATAGRPRLAGALTEVQVASRPLPRPARYLLGDTKPRIERANRRFSEKGASRRPQRGRGVTSGAAGPPWRERRPAPPGGPRGGGSGGPVAGPHAGPGLLPEA